MSDPMKPVETADASAVSEELVSIAGIAICATRGKAMCLRCEVVESEVVDNAKVCTGAMYAEYSRAVLQAAAPILTRAADARVKELVGEKDELRGQIDRLMFKNCALQSRLASLEAVMKEISVRAEELKTAGEGWTVEGKPWSADRYFFAEAELRALLSTSPAREGGGTGISASHQGEKGATGDPAPSGSPADLCKAEPDATPAGAVVANTSGAADRRDGHGSASGSGAIAPEQLAMERISYNQHGLDDIAVGSVQLFRMERMSDESFWIRLYRADGRDIVFNLASASKIEGIHEYDFDEPESKIAARDTFDVIEIEIGISRRVRVLGRQKTERNAEAIVSMAVMRRGVESHFYKAVPAGIYNDGDIYP